MANFAPLTNGLIKMVRSLLKHTSTTPAVKTTHPPYSVSEPKKPKELISKQNIHR